MSYPFDPQTRDYLASLLYGGLPEFLRDADRLPEGREDLRRLLAVLAAPLAIARQSIEELHSDLFIDTSDDWVLRYLAEMVGTTLIFPDADSNRRDVRSTVALRRRKGTPRMLRDLGEDLTEQMIVTQEGWRLVQMTQDLDLLRPERVLPDIRPAIVAEQGAGPLCALHHLPDVRSITATTGIFHPLHVAHWAHATRLFPLDEGTPLDLRDPATDPDFRFAFHPLGVFRPLRAARAGSQDRAIQTDRIPPMHFDQSPGVWFDQPRGIGVRIGGVAAALAEPADQPRIVFTRLAGPEIAAGAVTIELLDHDSRRFQTPVVVELALVSLNAGVPDTGNAGAIDVRAGLEISSADQAIFTAGNAGPADPARVAMLRLRVPAGATYFPGAIVQIAGGTAAARLASEDRAAAVQGFLRGGLVVRLPATAVTTDRWLFLGIDGSCFEAQSSGGGPADVPATDLGGGIRTVSRQRLLAQSPAAAWPPLAPRASPDPLLAIPSAPGRGPLVLHGGRVLAPAGGGFADLPAGIRCGLVFALRVGIAVPEYHPFLRLAWTGPEASAATWSAIDDAAADTPLNPRWEAIARMREERIDESGLLVRLECEQVDARLAPAEIAWNGFDGESVLIYLPELIAAGGNPLPAWAPAAGLPAASAAVAIAADGSTWNEPLAANLRMSLGDVAPLAEPPTLRRRIVRHRRLCAWRNEVPPANMLAATLPGRLDIDVEYGLFAMAGGEALRPYPAGPLGLPVPPAVTVAYQDGYTSHVGALPAAREPLLDLRLRTPTRIISASGRLHQAAPSHWFAIPRYTSLSAALGAIAAAPQQDEVVQFEDSATYAGENIDWPAGVRSLVLQAAERQRPTIVVANWTVAAGATYDEFEWLGLAFSAAADGVYAVPPAAQCRLLMCSIVREGMRLQFDLTGAAELDQVEVQRCLTAGLELVGSGTLVITASVIDAGQAAGASAIAAQGGEIRLDETTVFGAIRCRVLSASESILTQRAQVTDRFAGCVRFSRVTSDSVLPRIHRVVKDVAVRFVSVDRHNPAHARLDVDADRRVAAGAEDGGEMGAFHDVGLPLRYEGYRRRLDQSTPAGLTTAIIRLG